MDRNFYLELVKINGKYIYLVPKKYRDKEIYLTSGIYALEYLPNNEEESKYIALEILSNVHYSYLRLLSPNIIGYREIVLSVLDKNKDVLKYVSEEKRDSEIRMEAVKHNCNALQYVPEILRDEIEIVYIKKR